MKDRQIMTASRIRRVHLELTEKCNARCPLCLRTNPNGLSAQPYIQANELSLGDIHRFFPERIKNRLASVHLCGNYGDPIMASQCGEIADYLSSPGCAVSLSTNGGVRSLRWWADLGKTLKRNPDSRVDFHIDGLADTNAYYRRGTRFDRIVENAVSFIEAGGRANWEFIPFRHNQHQIEAAREMSKELGFERFTVKKSNRLFSEKKPAIPFTDRAGKPCILEAPTVDYKPDLAQNRMPVSSRSEQNQEITCLSLEKKEIYISCEAILYPCCWTARFARNIYLGRATRDGFSPLFYEFDGNTVFDLRQTDLETALESDFFHRLNALWKEHQPAICYRKCGKKDQPAKVKLVNS